MKDKKFVHLYKLLPDMLTLLAICLGITSIRYALVGRFEVATMLIIFAAFLDGIDGRIARFLGSSSDFGANLDSLADVANFGVSPAIIVYLWSLHDIPFRGVGWAVVLIYVVCGVLRLARFNTSHTSVEGDDTRHKLSEAARAIYIHKHNFFVGVPIPAAALLVLTPMVSTFKLLPFYHFPPMVIALYMVFVGILMISHIPVFAGKYVKISSKSAKFVMALIWLAAMFVVITPWFTVPVLSLLYVVAMPIGFVYYYMRLRVLQELLQISNSRQQRRSGVQNLYYSSADSGTNGRTTINKSGSGRYIYKKDT